MNYFEQELRRLAKACGEIKNPTFAGRACYGDLGGDNRVKLQFVTLNVHEKYEAVKATVLNRFDGEVDTLLFRFRDTWGRMPVNNPNFRDGVIPYIWTYQSKSEWYVYKPTDADFKKLAAEIGGYLSVFTDRSHTPEKVQEAAEKDSVVKKIRSTKQAGAPPQKPSGRKKAEPEL